jgi:DNA invertase Pin-like site-specific DNA recombinase
MRALQTAATVGSSKRARAAAVLGYASIVAVNGHQAGRDLGVQTKHIVTACECRGLSLVEVVREREPTRGHALERPGLGYALARISAGEAGGLVVADLSRLTRSVPELGRVLEWFSRSDARLIAASPGFDTGDEPGQLTARLIIELSQWERQRLSERTRKGMQEARRRGQRSVADNPQLRDRIGAMRADGMTLQAIANSLNADGVPTVRGGVKWRPSSVHAAAGYRRPTTIATLGSRVVGAQRW